MECCIVVLLALPWGTRNSLRHIKQPSGRCSLSHLAAARLQCVLFVYPRGHVVRAGVGDVSLKSLAPAHIGAYWSRPLNEQAFALLYQQGVAAVGTRVAVTAGTA